MGGDSGLGFCDATVIHESVDFVDGVVRVTVVMVLAGTTGGATSFERPDETDLLSIHLGGYDIMAVCHLQDASVTSAAETFHEASVSI